jgi:hypothetical protein
MLAMWWAAPVLADTPKPIKARSYKPYPAIEVTNLVFDEPRPIRAWTVRVDLTSPAIEFVTTPRGDVDDRLETACATTMDFAKAEDVDLAVNATPFSPLRSKPGEGMDLIGLGARDGDVYSPPHPEYGALIVTADGALDIVEPPIAEATLAKVDDAVGGFHVLVKNGASRASIVTARVARTFAEPNPRSAVGLSADKKTLWIIVIDGRNRNRTEGMTLDELADYAVSIGCDSLLNLDGGGSTTLVLRDPASEQWRMVNQPVGRHILGTMRQVGNSFGIRVRPRATEE